MGSVRDESTSKSPRMVETQYDESYRGIEIRHGRRYYSIRELRRSSWKDYKVLVEQLQSMGDQIVRRIIRQVYPPQRRYISDVLPYRSIDERDQLLAHLHSVGGSHTGGLFAFVDDETHIHIQHDCAWSDRSCRCKWKKTIKPGSFQRNAKRKRILREFSNDDWYDYFIYYFLRKWGPIPPEIWLNGEIQRLPTSGELYSINIFIFTNTV